MLPQLAYRNILTYYYNIIVQLQCRGTYTLSTYYIPTPHHYTLYVIRFLIDAKRIGTRHISYRNNHRRVPRPAKRLGVPANIFRRFLAYYNIMLF